MGIKNLNTILKTIDEFPEIKIQQLGYSVVGVDFSLFIYRFMYNRNNPFECFLKQLTLFFNYNILPVYVFDGIAPEEKNDLLNKRANKRDKNAEELNKLIELKNIGMENLDDDIDKLEKRCVNIPRDIYQNLIYFFDICGLPIIQENYESDWILAKLSQNKLIDFILSEDSDIFVHGGLNLMKKFSLNNETTTVYDLNTILKKLDINHKQFIDLCILCGCDYCPKIKNLNAIKAYELIKEFQSIEEIILNIPSLSIDMQTIKAARNVFEKKICPLLLDKLSNKIIKKKFQYENIERFLNKNIDRKYLIQPFIRSCRKFLYK